MIWTGFFDGGLMMLLRTNRHEGIDVFPWLINSHRLVEAYSRAGQAKMGFS